MDKIFELLAIMQRLQDVGVENFNKLKPLIQEAASKYDEILTLDEVPDEGTVVPISTLSTLTLLAAGVAKESGGHSFREAIDLMLTPKKG